MPGLFAIVLLKKKKNKESQRVLERTFALLCFTMKNNERRVHYVHFTECRRQCAGLFTCKVQQFIRNDLVKCIGWLVEQKQCQMLHTEC